MQWICSRYVAACCLAVWAVLATGPGAAQQSGQGAGGSQNETGLLSSIDISSRLYTNALELKAADKCDQAVPLLYRLATRGQGFQLAQFHLGECLMRRAEESATSTEFLSGLVWVRRSAEAGVPQGQATLALLYLGGPESLRDKAEAAYWFALFQTNPERKKPGFSSPLSEREQERIKAALPEELRAEAEERAENWRSRTWEPPDAGLSQVGENLRR